MSNINGRRAKTPTQRRQRTRSLRKHSIKELPTPARYNRFIEALEVRDARLGIRPSGRYLRKRNVTAEAAKVIRDWCNRWLCPGATDRH